MRRLNGTFDRIESYGRTRIPRSFADRGAQFLDSHQHAATRYREHHLFWIQNISVPDTVSTTSRQATAGTL